MIKLVSSAIMFERSYSRRKILLGSAFAGISAAGADRILKDGLFLKSPDLTPRHKRINLSSRDTTLTQDIAVDLESQFRPLRINRNTYVYYNTDDDLIFQHEKAAFSEKKRYKVSHRSGNMRSRVDEAIKLGANGIDIDVVSRPDAEILASHTLAVEGLEIGPIGVGGLFDVSEVGVRTRIPRTGVDMVNYIGSRNTPENPLVVTMELKSSSFPNKQASKNLIAAISANSLPTWVFSAHQSATDDFYEACEEYAREQELIF